MNRTLAFVALLCTAWMPRTALAQTIDTIAGNGTTGTAGDGGLAVNASMTNPKGLVLLPGGLLVADDGNHTVRKVDFVTGIIERVAGNGTTGGAGDGGPALKYVSCVAKTANSFRDALLISEEQKGEITSAAAESSCGHKK